MTRHTSDNPESRVGYETAGGKGERTRLRSSAAPEPSAGALPEASASVKRLRRREHLTALTRLSEELPGGYR